MSVMMAPKRVGGAFANFEPGARSGAHASAGPDADRHVWLRPGAVRGWSERGIRPGGVAWSPAKIIGTVYCHHCYDHDHIAIAQALDGKSVVWMLRQSASGGRAPRGSREGANRFGHCAVT